jgi:subtilase family serine protease
MQLSTLRRVFTASAILAIGAFAAIASAQAPIKVGSGTPIRGGTNSSAAAVTASRMPGLVVVPPSSVPVPADRGKKAHSNFSYITPASGEFNPQFPPPGSGYAYETPASLACLYKLVAVTTGCNPLTVSTVATGGSQKIAIVDAFDDPEAAADLAYFSDQFGLPFKVSQFKVIQVPSQYGYPAQIDPSGGWEMEESLDIEMAHAMAPNATIYLFESYDNSYVELQRAVQTAINWIQCGNFTQTAHACSSATGKGEVSMSWGGGEFSGETGTDPVTGTPYDPTFATANSANVVFLASAGDSPGPIWPSTSPYVISVGGTTISRNLSTGNFNSESAWSDAGGGRSVIEPEPAFQSSVATVHAVANGRRATPDVAAVANPYTGVYVYDTFPMDIYYYTEAFWGDWWIVGGTSASAPLWAGVINNAATVGSSFAANTQAELTKIYSNIGAAAYTTNFRDVTYGLCNYYQASISGTGWDQCTGVGTPQAFAGK